MASNCNDTGSSRRPTFHNNNSNNRLNQQATGRPSCNLNGNGRGQFSVFKFRKMVTSTYLGRLIVEKLDEVKSAGAAVLDRRSRGAGAGGEGEMEGWENVGERGGVGEVGEVKDKIYRRSVTEKQLVRLGEKIDKLLTRLEEGGRCRIEEEAASSEDECVICLSAKATTRTHPCGHRVMCRRCFIRTIQTAIAQRHLPLRCPVCRSRILKLNDELSESTPVNYPRCSAGGFQPPCSVPPASSVRPPVQRRRNVKLGAQKY